MLSQEFADPCLERNYIGHFQAITLARFNPDGKKVVTSSLGECYTTTTNNESFVVMTSIILNNALA